MKTKLRVVLTILMGFVMTVSLAQSKTITGVVSDEKGEPLPAATVLIEGTSNGVSTDFDGLYSIEAETGDVISYSYVGFLKQTITVTNETKIDIKLKTDNELEEVVIVGYKAQNKQKITGSVAVVTAEQIEQVPIASFDQILQGQAAGLQVSVGTGQPGSAAKVRIRGNGSITGSNDPLFIVDGVQITASDYAALSPNDFSSVSVLKDASSTAQYGSRGANGVIVITTKKGTYDQPLEVTYKTQYGVATVGDAPFEAMNTRDLLRLQRRMNVSRGAGLTDQQIEDIANETDTDWSDIFFRSAQTSSHDLSLTGGNEKSRYYSSIGYFNQEGIILRSDLQRFTVRNNIEHSPNKKTKIGFNSTIGYLKTNAIDSDGSASFSNPVAAAYLASPYDTPYNANGSVNSGPNRIGGNALERLLENGRNQNEVKIVGNLYAQKEIFKNITGKIDVGIDYSQENDIVFITPGTYAGSLLLGRQGLYNESNRYEAVLTNTNNLTYSNTFNEKHSLNAGVYLEYVKTNRRSSQFAGFGINPLTNGFANSITPGTTGNGLIPVVTGANGERGLFSYFTLTDYDYDSRYGFSASLRRDASSKFSEENRWGTFYSVAGRWNISNENFMESVNFVNDLKLRVSYGTSGNQNAAPDFSALTQYSTTSYNGQVGLAPGRIGNPELVWETSNQFNVGLDFGLFKNNSVHGSIEYYNNVTTDLFVDFRLPASAGRSGISANEGSMRNSGYDVDLNFDIINKEDLKLTLFGNVNYNKNEILDLGQVNEFVKGSAIIREGLPLDSHFVVEWAGVNPANGEPLYYDLNGNVTNVFSPANATATHGSSNPEYTGGFGFDFNYKGWQVSTLFSYVGEYFLFNNQKFFGESPNLYASNNQLTSLNNMWQQPGDVTDIQSYLYPRQFSSRDIEDASFTRFRNLTIAYNFPKELLNATKYIKKLRIYSQAQNLYTWTNYTGLDPEDDNNISFFQYPTPRTFTVGLDISF